MISTLEFDSKDQKFHQLVRKNIRFFEQLSVFPGYILEVNLQPRVHNEKTSAVIENVFNYFCYSLRCHEYDFNT